MYRNFGKRLLDLILATIVLLLLSPCLLVIALILATIYGRNIFFWQLRPGLGGEPFYLLKFKTMSDERDEFGNLLPDFLRITGVGRWIRKFSLDECLQLLNVIKGEMSLVGPRPLLMEYLPLYNKIQLRRHEVRPGITGLAQVQGRNEIDWEQRFAYDVYYVDNVTFLFDLKIIWSTLKIVGTGQGVNSRQMVTMERFTGSQV